MRILAIRGRNLASLSGDFEVNLGEPPISEVGLFAISGPTGSGKTTLLDAMCLALFDRTPRLSDRGGVWVGHAGQEDAERIASQDVRSLLRKGTASGYAEVDFSGRDGRGYRARWSVRRARDRVEGALQKQAMTLHEIGLSAPLGRTKVEVLEAIEKKLGLSFEQFRRSALLAQGDFAAFLGADERARAELLEQMTGTWIYGEVSARAYERHREEALGLVEVEGRARELRVLAAEAREALAGELGSWEAAAAEHKAALGAAEQARGHYRALAALASQEAEAVRSRDEARAAVDAAAGLREELERFERALPLRSLLAQLDAASLSAREEELAAAAREAEAGELAALEAAALSRWRAAERLLEERRASLASMGPEIERATRLDADVRSQEQLFRAAALEASSAGLEASSAGREASEAALLLERAEASRARAEQELGRRSASLALSEEWEGVRVEMRRYVQVQQALGKLDRPGAAARAELAAEAGARAAREFEAAGARASMAEAEVARAAGALPADEPSRLRAEKELLMRREALTASLAREALDALSLRAAIDEAKEAAQQARDGGERAAAQAEQASRRALRIEEALASSTEALRAARAAHDLAAYRGALREGEHCPLCGATEHPWAAGEPELEARLDREEERQRQLLSSQSEEQRVAVNARAQVRERRERAEEQELRAAGLTAQLAAVEESFREGRLELGALGLPESASSEGAAAAVELERGEVARALARVRAAEEEADRLGRRLLALRAESDEGRRELDRLRATAAQLGERADAAARELARIDEELGRGRAEQQRVLEAVAPYFEGRTGWREALGADGVAFGVACLGEVTAYRGARQALEASALELAALAPRAAASARRARERGEEARSRAVTAEGRGQALAALRAERALLLGGESTERVVSALTRSAAEAEREERLSHAAHEASDKAAARASAALEGALRVLASKRATLAAASAALAEGLLAWGLAEPELRELLSRDEGWGAARAAELARLELEVTLREALVAERAARRREHEEAGAPAVGAGEVEAAIEASRARLSDAEEQASACKLRLRDDDRERERAAGLAAHIAEKRARVELWASVSQLIGSADGKKFRVFAQSLTFDSLIYLANQHLDDLARRYQLMRVPKSDLDLQVIDREMADEARSVSSLSGGETFLVSLSLALGLSSLGSRETRVETLFIDEGFGTLDPESLEVALSSLDALQSSGRKVGLISHVPGLSERLGVQVRVQPRGAGRSIVTTVG